MSAAEPFQYAPSAGVKSEASGESSSASWRPASSAGVALLDGVIEDGANAFHGKHGGAEASLDLLAIRASGERGA